MNKISCIIPVYNENPRVIEVLKAVTRVSEIDEIICVDDGSIDGSGKSIRQHYPKTIVVSHTTNKGKARAILTGLQKATNKDVLLLDSDLLNLQSAEITKAIHSYYVNNLDCLLLCVFWINPSDNLLRIPICFSGSRIIKRNILVNLFSSPNINHYQLEIAINRYLLENKMKVAHVNISAKNVTKSTKLGWLNGTIKELKMWKQIITFAGLPFFLKQTLFFARKKVG